MSLLNCCFLPKVPFLGPLNAELTLGYMCNEVYVYEKSSPLYLHPWWNHEKIQILHSPEYHSSEEAILLCNKYADNRVLGEDQSNPNIPTPHRSPGRTPRISYCQCLEAIEWEGWRQHSWKRLINNVREVCFGLIKPATNFYIWFGK